MENKAFLRRYWPEIVVLALVSLLFGLPHVLSYLLLAAEGKQYYPLIPGLNWIPSDETIFVAPRVREVYEGHFLAGENALAEYKGSPAIFPFINPILLGLFTHLTRSISLTFMLSDFIFPPISFLLPYLLALRFTKNRAYSLFFAGIIVIRPQDRIWGIPLHLGDFLGSIFNPPQTMTYNPLAPFPLWFSRSENPQLTFIPLILGILFSYIALEKNRIRYAVLAGLSLGALLYSYTFDFAYLGAGIAMLFIILSFSPERRKHWKILGVIFLVTALTSFYYWVNLLNLRSLPQFPDLLVRTGAYSGYRPGALYYVESILVGALLLYFGRGRLLSLFLVSLILGGMLLLTSAFFADFVPQPTHWERAVSWGVFLGLLASIYYALEGKYQIRWAMKMAAFAKRNLTVLSAAAVALIFIYAFAYQASYALSSYRGYTISEGKAEAYQWLDENTPSESVVMSPSFFTNYLVMVYTHNNVFLPTGSGTVAPTEEIMDRLFITYKTFNIPVSHLERMLSGEWADFPYDVKPRTAFMRKDYLFHNKFYSNNRVVPEDFKSKAILDFAGYKLDEAVDKYRVDYIMVDERARSIMGGDLNAPSGWVLRPVFHNSEVDIFEVVGGRDS